MINFLRKFTRLGRRIPGGVLVCDPIRKAFAGRKRVVRVTDFDGSMTMFLDLNEHMQSQIFWYGTYSRDIIFLLRRILKPGMVVIDGGANIGEISVVAANRVGKNGRVYAFEPVPTLADQLQKHADANSLENLIVCRSGLSNRRGEAPFYVATPALADGTHNDGIGSLYSSAGRSEGDLTIPLITLDSFADERLERVDLVKLDLEGGELAALEGAANLLRTQGPALIVEIGEETCSAAGYGKADIFELLESQGYSTYSIGRHGRLVRVGAEDLGRSKNIYCVKE